MKQIITVILFCILSLPVYSSSMLDVDYNFIDTAFDGIKPVTNKQFDDTVNALTPAPAPTTLGGKIKTFFFGRQKGVQPAPKGQDKEIDIGGELKAIQDMQNGIFYIKLIVSIVGENNQVIPAGNYKIKQETINSEEKLVFYQGREEYGKLKLKKYSDIQKKENNITYSRVDVLDEKIVRIVYATLDDTKCAYARVYLQN